MDLFNPAFTRTFFPGWSSVPEAERDIFCTFKSSITTRAWFLLIDVVALCRKSLRTLAILRCRRWILALSFRQLAENFTRFAALRCKAASFFSCFRKLCNGLREEPSESVAKRAIPISIPTAVCKGCTGSGTSRSVWMETYHFPADSETVTCLGTPSVARLFRYRIHPILGRNMRLFPSSSLKPCG